MATPIKTNKPAAVPVQGAEFDLSPWFELMAEGSRFYAERLRAVQELQAAMIGCKTPVELVGLQSAFAQNAAAQYSAEMARCLELLTKGAPQTPKTARTAVCRSYDDIPV